MNMFPNEVGTSANIDGGSIMFVYKVIKKNHYSPETGAYISFGISAHDPQHGQTCFVPDVFIGEPEARAFTERLNTLQVSPIHLIDVIEDALGV